MTTECPHPLTRRMIINGVVHCLDCKMDMYSGLCRKCGRALDDHSGIGTADLVCPKDDGIPA